MGIFFSKHQKSRVTEQDRAILQLKQQRDKLKQYRKRAEDQIETHRHVAKDLLSEGKKEKALLLLRKKRYQEKLIDNTEIQLQKIERLTADLEFAQMEMQVVDGLNAGNSALKELHQILSLDDVQKIMEETNDSLEYQREIDELISGSMTRQDSDAAMRELESLLGVESDANKLPDVPTTEMPEPRTARPVVRKAEPVLHKRVAMEAL